jgi:hypothetical protein
MMITALASIFLSAVVLAGSLPPLVAFRYRGGWDSGEATVGVLV